MQDNSLGDTAEALMDQVQDSGAVRQARHSLEDVRSNARNMAKRGKDAILAGMARATDGFNATGERTRDYVQARPLNALLWAAAAGAAIALLAATLGTRQKRRWRN